MKKSILMTLSAFAVAGLVMFASPSMAVHKGSGDLTCGNCHTMHSSQGGTNSSAMGGATGSFILLRKSGTTRATIHNFCLQCHAQEGAQGGDKHAPLDITAPKVLTTFGYTNGDNFSVVGAGGDFSHVGTYDGSTYTAGTDDDGSNTALGYGHSIGSASTVIPPGNNTTSNTAGAALDSALSCTTCHDPHGTASSTDTINRYRNLKTGDSNTGANALGNGNHSTGFGDFGVSYAGGTAACAPSCSQAQGDNMGTSVNAAINTWPVFCSSCAVAGENQYLMKSTFDPDTAQASVSGTYVGISLFCAQCHGAWHEMLATTNASGDDWTRHPVNNVLDDVSSRSSGGKVDIFDEDSFAGIADGTRLPASSTTANSYTSQDATDSQTARVFCLSCHFVHGSPNYDILRWDYTSAVSSGSQSGNGVATGTGCQQCHNR